MLDSYKYIVCHKCKYFPIKLQQHKTPSITIIESQIKWSCEACLSENRYQLSDTIKLIDDKEIKIKPSQLLEKKKIQTKTNILIVIDCHSQYMNEVAYQSIENSKKIEKVVSINISSLKSMSELSKQSILLKQFSKRKASIDKFNFAKMQSNSIKNRQYILFIIQQLAQNQQTNRVINRETYVQERITKLIVRLQHQSGCYQFCFNCDLFQNNANIEQFILVYSILTMQKYPIWLIKIYKQQLLKSKQTEIDDASYETLLYFGLKDIQQIQKKYYTNSIKMNFGQLKKQNKIKVVTTSKNQLKNHQYSLFPISSKYIGFALKFKTYQQIIKAKLVKKDQYINIFYRFSINKKTLLYKASIKQMLRIKKLLQKGKILREVDQFQLLQFVTSITPRDYLNNNQKQIVKISGQLQLNRQTVVYLLTFNWKHNQDATNYEYLDQEIKYDYFIQQIFSLTDNIPSQEIKISANQKQMNQIQIELKNEDRVRPQILTDEDYIFL